MYLTFLLEKAAQADVLPKKAPLSNEDEAHRREAYRERVVEAERMARTLKKFVRNLINF